MNYVNVHLNRHYSERLSTTIMNGVNEMGSKPRFGAVGKHGSIAIIERFILSIKNDGIPD